MDKNEIGSNQSPLMVNSNRLPLRCPASITYAICHPTLVCLLTEALPVLKTFDDHPVKRRKTDEDMDISDTHEHKFGGRPDPRKSSYPVAVTSSDCSMTVQIQSPCPRPTPPGCSTTLIRKSRSSKPQS